MAKVTLGGKTCEATSEIAWIKSDGAAASRCAINLSPEDAKAVFESGAEVELVIDPDVPGERKTTIKRLTVVGYEPSSHPQWARVLVADLRWRWDRKILSKGYNVPKRTGVKRVAAAGEPPELQDVDEEFGFARWSLKVQMGTTVSPWRGDEVLLDVLGEMPGVNLGDVSIDADLKSSLASYPVEDLMLEGNAAIQLQVVLDFLPQAAIAVDDDGKIRVYSKASGAEASMYSLALPEEEQGGHVVFLDNKIIRPAYVDVFVPFEVETRHNYQEVASGQSQAQIGDQRLMENVAPVPDHTLTLASGKVVCQGTMVTIDELFAAWRAQGGIDSAFWTHDKVQKAFTGWLDYFGAMGESGELQPDADIMARIDCIRDHYRQTYRLNPRWRDAFLTIAACRIAVIDPSKGTRAKSPVYADHCKIPSARGKWKSIADRGKMSPYMNHPSGLASATAEISGNVEQAPAIVTVIDQDQGIIRIEYRVDIFKQASAVLPSLVENGPTVDFTQAGTANVIWDAVREGQGEAGVPKLDDQFQLSLIITGTPAGPNNKNRFFKIRIFPGDVKGMLPPAAAKSIGSALGPPVEIIYRGETARVAWVDAAAERIERICGVGRPPDQPLQAVDDLVVNYSTSSAKHGASLRGIALAVAAQVYAEYADGLVGDMVGRLNPDLKLMGRLGQIAYVVAPDGNCTTHLKFDPRMPKPSLIELFDPATKKVVRQSKVLV